jgi:hypothetical protein
MAITPGALSAPHLRPSLLVLRHAERLLPLSPPNVSGEMNFPIARLVCDQINLAVIIPCHI